MNSCPQVSHVTLRLHVWTQVYKRPYSTAAIFNMSPRHTSLVTCFYSPQPLVHRRAPSEQQVKVKLTHHQQQAGSRLKGLSMVIIAISKKAAPATRTRFLAFIHLSLAQNAGVSCQLFYMSKALQKKGWGHLSVIQRTFLIQRPGKKTGVETKRLGSRVFS